MINARDICAPSDRSAARPRVLQVGKYYPPYMGGIETHMHTLCRELSGAVDVRVVVANTGPATTHERVDGIDVARMGRAFNLSAAPICPGLVARLRATPADIVHVHLPNPMAVLAYLASGHSGRLVVSYHSDVVRQRVLERLFRPILKRFLARAESIVVATPNHIDSSPVLRPFRSRCTVIPYGIPLRESSETDLLEASRIRDQYGPRIVLGVGRQVYYKGFHHLIRAMASVDARLLLIGDGPLRGQLERTAREAGVADRVTFLGKVHDIGAFYRAADVFVLPSVARSEAFGIVQLEAMAGGTPVVNTSLDSGVPYVSLHERTGLTVPPGDSEALARAIERLLVDPELRARFGSAARRRVEDEFRKEVMAERMLSVYATVLSSAEAARPSTAVRTPAGGRPKFRRAISLTDSAS